MIPKFRAHAFHRFLTTGRTLPALFTCGTGDEQDEFVVKLRGGMERPDGMLCELYASLLARRFGIYLPSPAIVLIENDLTEAILEAKHDQLEANIIRNSVGWNFGSRFITNLSIWPTDKHVPVAMQEDATRVFAFDALIQNPDRRFDKPNLGTCGSQIVIFDHELAFSFLQAIFVSPEPWKLEKEDYLQDHVFARRLKGQECPADFIENLSQLSEAAFREFAEQIPEDWHSDSLSRIEAHVRRIHEHANEFAEEVRRRLA